MKRNIFAVALISAMLAGAAGTAMASDAYPEGSQLAWVPQTSALSRDQVKAELASAQSQGLVEQTDAVYPRIGVSAPANQVAQAMVLASLQPEEGSNISPQP